MDFDPSPQPLLFTSNSSRACASFTIIDDIILEGVESFEVSLSAEEDPAILFGLSSVVVEIEDNDHVTVGMIKESYAVAEEGGAVEVCIRLTGTIERVVTVTMATEGGSASGEYELYNNIMPGCNFTVGLEIFAEGCFAILCIMRRFHELYADWENRLTLVK